MAETRVVIVMLRQPRRNEPGEMRTDPLWEFGSFGCTRCHSRNLMNPARLHELNGTHLAFAQNGPLGVKLVHVTPPVTMLHHGAFGEAKWRPAVMPVKYASAPTLVNNFGHSDIAGLLEVIDDVRRHSLVAQFASRFRSRRTPLPDAIGRRIIKVYERFRSRKNTTAESYVAALPYDPPLIDLDRRATYRRLLPEGASEAARIARRCVGCDERHRC